MFSRLSVGLGIPLPLHDYSREFNINHTCAGSVSALPCLIVRETLLHSSLHDHFNNSFFNFPTNVFSKLPSPNTKKQNPVFLQYLQFSFIFRLKIDVCFLITTDLMHQFGCFSILFSNLKIYFVHCQNYCPLTHFLIVFFHFSTFQRNCLAFTPNCNGFS